MDLVDLECMLRTQHNEVMGVLKTQWDFTELVDALIVVLMKLERREQNQPKRRRAMKKSGAKQKSSKPMPFIKPGGKGRSEAPKDKRGAKRGR